MKNKWTRREFLGATLVTTASIGVVGVDSLIVDGSIGVKKRIFPTFDSNVRQLLRAAMDEIIPSNDGMPAASQVGGMEYLERIAAQDLQLRHEFDEGLATLDRVSRTQFKEGFMRLSPDQRVRALSELETTAAPGFFRVLRDYVYEAYYLQPEVQKLIGYEFYPFQKPVPLIKPFDETVLAKVRKMPKLYREVG